MCGLCILMCWAHDFREGKKLHTSAKGAHACIASPTVILLIGNNIDAEGARDLSLALTQCPQLQILNLSCQYVVVLGWMSLERARSTEEIAVH